MGAILLDIIVFLAVLFLLVVIISPIIYLFEKDRESKK